jgi:carbon storage regulator
MLVLSRKMGESICIGKDVVVNIVKVSGNRVRIGISAPRNIEVVRGELPQWSSDDHAAMPSLDGPAGPSSSLEFEIASDCCI